MNYKTFDFIFEPLTDGIGKTHIERIKAIDLPHAYLLAQKKLDSKVYKLVYKVAGKTVCKPTLVVKKSVLVRCVLCGRIADRTHSANPCKLKGECCDECWINRVIPAQKVRALKKYGNLVFALGGKTI